ncbi:cytochrome P460 family protein [Methylotuvimicrobium sp. KM1]|uniref:cytochrome P460 family protein n=1 Tax=Methylotuvimicrobium sp. KM1 TaxID=3377707 RepID=UPI00384F9F07
MASHNIITKQKLIALICFSSITISAPSFADDGMQASQNYARFDQSGQLIRPTGYREWIFIGTPLTPNDMNDGKAAFPEFHNVYIDPASWAHWKKLGEFPDGTIIVKELVSVGSKQAPSGNGYFQGEYIGLEAMVKSGRQFPKAPGNWGFFRFTIEDSPLLHSSAKAQPGENCQACHQKHAAKDQVFTQFYPVLRAAAGKGQAGTGR